MPGTTRYSATFDRPYQEDEKSSSGVEPAGRRSRSMSCQAQERLYSPLGGCRTPPPPRSSSTDGESKGVETIPTRTVAKTVVKTHNNPFQFVKVGSSPLYRKAEEQLKKAKEVKKPDVLKEEEEEWQSNLDSWKSRRRKMSEDIFRRQDEIRKSEIEEQFMQANNNQKKTKTFSEMVESRATRGRALSLCLISSPLDLQKWELENGNTSNSIHPFSEGSEENSAFNSEDEGVSDKHLNDSSNCSNGNGSHVTKNGTSNGVKRKSNNLLEMSSSSPHKDGIYVDSGLESISSSHRAGDTPDSCSDFSQDSGSSIDCDSPRVSGLMLNEMNVMDFNSKLLNSSDNSDSFTKMKGTNPNNCSDNTMDLNEASVSNGELTNGACVNSNDYHEKVDSSSSSSLSSNGEYHISNAMNCSTPLKLERSVESENEVFVDDFEELKASTQTFSQSNQESSVEIKALQTCNESTDLPKPLKICIDDSTLEKSSISKMPNSEEKKLDEFKKEVTESGFHSEIQKVEPVAQKEPKRKTVKKKKLKAKASVETCIEKSQPLLVQSANSPVSNLSEESLNIVFQSKSLNQDSQPDFKKELKRSSSNSKEILLNDVPPVEQVAEEMEKLILQQLEEEERAKEMSSKMLSTNVIVSPDHNLIAPPKVSEPPKEKPPPPPSAEADIPKPTSLKRINSTKRIKKEIHKRRSNFLGIENMDDNLGFDESSVPPPLALEEILKAEMELDRESMKRLEDAATERIKMEEIEIIEKEREIIETLETEERQKNLINNEELCEIMLEEDRIQKLKDERMRMGNERTVNEAQRLRLEEEKLLKEREECIRKQEVDNASTEISTPLLSEVANTSNISSPPIASLSAETKANDLLSNTCGDGETIAKTASLPLDSNKSEVGKPEVPPKPVVPPKPLKKKEAIRKERERLRQEQEALQREREEHRQKLLLEQEETLKTQPKSHAAPTTPVSRIGPVPPLKPTYSPQLTNPVSAPPRDKVSFPSQSFHGAPNGLSDSFVEQVPVVSKQTKPLPMHKKPVQKEPWMQQKVPSVKKQSQDPMPDSKYNQNHWLIQEAEMRRISELKERQLTTHFLNSQTHLLGDEVSRSSTAHPATMPPATLPPPLQENMWSYGHANPVKYPKKYSPPVAPEKPVGMYPPVPPNKPSRVVPLERQEQMLSVSGRKRCSHCSEELGRGAAMIIESLQLYYHIHCFQCCVCQAQLGNGSCGTDVRVRNNKLHCHNCYSNDEAGLKFSQV